MGPESILTLGVISIMLIALVEEVLEPDAVIFGALGILLVSGVLTPAKALVGFSNRGMLTPCFSSLDRISGLDGPALGIST